MRVRILIVAIWGAFLGVPEATAQSVSLRLSSANAFINGEVSLDLVLSASGTVRPAALQWRVEHSTMDLALSQIRLGPAGIAAGKTLTCQGPEGQKSCVLAGLLGGKVNSNLIGDGIVARVGLRVNPDAVAAPSEVRLTASFAATPLGASIPVSLSSGTVNIAIPVSGSLTGIACNPTWIVAPGSAECSVETSTPAPPGGLQVTIQKGGAPVSAPPSVTISAGNTRVAFQVSAGSQTTAQGVTLTAVAQSGSAKSINLTVAPPIQLSSMTCAPQPIGPGESSVCTIQFRSPTPPPGVSINVSSNSTTLLAPPVLQVRPSKSSVRFRVDAAPLAGLQNARLTSEYRGSSVNETVGVTGGDPILLVPDGLAVIQGSKLEFEVSAADPSNLPVTISAINLPLGAQFSPSGLFQWTPQSFQLGSHTVRFRAMSSAGASVLKEATIRVVEAKPVLVTLLNSANLSSQSPCSPGGLATLLGTGITRSQSVSADVVPLPRKLADVEVMINGSAAPLLFVSATQVNFQCPQLAAGTTLNVVLRSSLGVSAPAQILMRHASPGIFTIGANGKGQGTIFLAGESSWAMIRNGFVPSRPAAAGEFVTIYATGLGPVNGTVADGQGPPGGSLVRAASEVEVLLDGRPAEVPFAGLAPGLVGAFQVNAIVPPGLAAGDEIPVLLRVKQPNGVWVQSNQVLMGIEDP